MGMKRKRTNCTDAEEELASCIWPGCEHESKMLVDWVAQKNQHPPTQNKTKKQQQLFRGLKEPCAFCNLLVLGSNMGIFRYNLIFHYVCKDLLSFSLTQRKPKSVLEKKVQEMELHRRKVYLKIPNLYRV